MEEQAKIDRRGFLRLGLGAAAVTGLSAAWAGMARADDEDDREDERRRGQRSRGTVPLNRIGIQLYSVRDVAARDFEGTLAAIAEIGYAEVEFAGLHGRTAEQVRDTIDGLGLKAPSSHVGVNAMNSNPEGVFGDAATLGQEWVIEPYKKFATLDEYRRLADDLNRAGETAREYGLRVGYHNHDHEFKFMEGTFPYAVLIEETDPRLVDLELDLYWALDAVADYGNWEAHPLALFDRAPERFKLYHVKDGVPNDPARDPHFEDIGEGVIDFTAYFTERAKKLAGVKHFVNERDDAPRDPEGSLGSAEDMYDNLVAEYGTGRR